MMMTGNLASFYSFFFVPLKAESKGVYFGFGKGSFCSVEMLSFEDKISCFN